MTSRAGRGRKEHTDDSYLLTGRAELRLVRGIGADEALTVVNESTFPLFSPPFPSQLIRPSLPSLS